MVAHKLMYANIIKHKTIVHSPWYSIRHGQRLYSAAAASQLAESVELIEPPSSNSNIPKDSPSSRSNLSDIQSYETSRSDNTQNTQNEPHRAQKMANDQGNKSSMSSSESRQLPKSQTQIGSFSWSPRPTSKVSSFTWSPRPSLTSSKEADNEKSQFMSPKTSSISTGQEKDPLKVGSFTWSPRPSSTSSKQQDSPSIDRRTEGKAESFTWSPRPSLDSAKQIKGKFQNTEKGTGDSVDEMGNSVGMDSDFDKLENQRNSNFNEKRSRSYRDAFFCSNQKNGNAHHRKIRDWEKMDERSNGRNSSSIVIKKKTDKTPSSVAPKDIYIPEAISVAQLSRLLGMIPTKLSKSLKSFGINETDPEYVLTNEIASLISMEFNKNPISNTPVIDIYPQPLTDADATHPNCAPIVTIMGHVDHGKTTLLDSLRKTSVAAGEAGGITQHIGAFSVSLPSGKQITFLDTPGHAAFTAMRARGAQMTNIVILVVAGDDGVKPQTMEAIRHAREANVPIVVAINKCDKPGIDLKRVKSELLANDVLLEDFGGEVPCVEISALKAKGLDELEETVVTLAEVLDIRADTGGLVEGFIVESKMEKGRGYTATVLVKRGTLKPSNILVAGTTWCKVKTMHNSNGISLKEAGPSQPIVVTGWKDLPTAGSYVLQVHDFNNKSKSKDDQQSKNEALARRVVDSRLEVLRRKKTMDSIGTINEKRAKEKQQLDMDREAQRIAKVTKVPIWKTKMNVNDYGPIVLPIILKADVHGSLEAIESAIMEFPRNEIRADIIHSGVGPFTSSDLDTISAVKGILMSFHLSQDKKILKDAASKSIPVLSSNIIYELLDGLKDKMEELLPPEIQLQTIGDAVVKQIFSVTVNGKSEQVSGCRVISGKLRRDHRVQIIRNQSVIFEGVLKTLRHFKNEVSEISKGSECGVAIEGFSDFEQGDIVRSYLEIEKKKRLEIASVKSVHA